MSQPSKYVISKFRINEPNLSFISLMESLEDTPKKDQDTIGTSNKCSILKIEMRDIDRHWNIYSGHFDIWGDSNDETFDPNAMEERHSRRFDKLKEKNTFVIAKNDQDEHIIVHKLNHSIKNSVAYFRKRFQDYCGNKIEYDEAKPADIFSQITQLKMISALFIRMRSGDISQSKSVLKNIGEKFRLNHDKLFGQYIKEKIWKEKSSYDTKYGENLIKFSKLYVEWLQSIGSVHTDENLINYLSSEFDNTIVRLREIEEAVILSAFCKRAKCQVHGYKYINNRELVIDFEAIKNGELVVEIITDSRKPEEEIISHIIDQIEMLWY